MKVIFNKKFFEVYDADPAAAAGRLEPTYNLMRKDSFYEFIEAKAATEGDILRAHTREHYERIKRSPQYEMAMLSAGGAIQTAELAFQKEPSFGFIRPPGHHASRDSCWGFCFFNNMSIALLKLISERKIAKAFILDFDLHTGDGNINILGDREGIVIFNPSDPSENLYLKSIKQQLDQLKSEDVDIICASAGFDNAIGDWGNTLSREGYRTIGLWLKDYSLKLCEGRRFAILEGGYNHRLMAQNIDAFCKGFG
ncbi:MAG: histone deacetylase family protein [Promethearchaeota archaeon]